MTSSSRPPEDRRAGKNRCGFFPFRTVCRFRHTGGCKNGDFFYGRNGKALVQKTGNVQVTKSTFEFSRQFSRAKTELKSKQIKMKFVFLRKSFIFHQNLGVLGLKLSNNRLQITIINYDGFDSRNDHGLEAIAYQDWVSDK